MIAGLVAELGPVWQARQQARLPDLAIGGMGTGIVGVVFCWLPSWASFSD
jgi:hypothetical protein